MKGLMHAVVIFEKIMTAETTVVFDPQDLYCGAMNCYDLLGVTRDADRGAIAKVAIFSFI